MTEPGPEQLLTDPDKIDSVKAQKHCCAVLTVFRNQFPQPCFRCQDPASSPDQGKYCSRHFLQKAVRLRDNYRQNQKDRGSTENEREEANLHFRLSCRFWPAAFRL